MKVKKLFQATVIIIVTIVLMSIFANAVSSYKMRYCQVTDVCDGYVIIEDNKGRPWKYYTDETVKVRTSCRLSMHDNYTEHDSSDDYIVSVYFEE